MRGDAFRRFARALEDRDTRSLLVLRNGRLVHEWHAFRTGRDEAQHIASLAKGVVGGLSLALLAGDGRLSLDAPAADSAPAWRSWRGDPARARITLRQLATHSSGLANAPGRSRSPSGGPSDWRARFWKLDPQRTPFQVALEEAPLLFPPGERLAYSNPGFAVLSLAIAAAVRDTPEKTLPAYLRARVFAPLAISDAEWSIGYGRSFDVGGTPVWATWGGARISAGALAKIGELLLRGGDWQGRRLLRPETVESLATYAGTALADAGRWPAPALGWWTNARGSWPQLPRDAFLAFGAGQKLLLVVPSLELVLVRLGGALEPEAAEDDFWGPLARHLIDPLMDAFPEPPVPWSEALSGAWLEPASSLVCKALGSDNWPITWTRDGSLFTAYGDGWGFEPRTDHKLSLGFARVDGGPRDFRGRNLRSASGERSGDGPSGAKASGLLAVDGVLYLFARNLENSQLAWSGDDGRTWRWGFRFDESFGSPTFLGFGPGYAGARDDYAYVYSQDGPSAYEADDRLVLARVPRDRIRERAAYEFFGGSDAKGRPRWTRSIEARAGVFAYPGACRRSEVVYDAGLARYLLALGFDSEGGWGIFEAPEPWGPWHTVHFTRRSDLGDSHSYRLPTRWIGDGGRSLALVVSGRDGEERALDAFCVRGLRILPVAAAPPAAAR